MTLRCLPTPVIPYSSLPGALPDVKLPLSSDLDIAQISPICIRYLEDLRMEHIYEGAFWKDMFFLNGNIRTFYKASAVFEAWHHLSTKVNPHNFKLSPCTAQVMKIGSCSAWITTAFLFQTGGRQAAHCSGTLHIIPDTDGRHQIWAMDTILEELVGLGNADVIPSKLPPFETSDLGCVV